MMRCGSKTFSKTIASSYMQITLESQPLCAGVLQQVLRITGVIVRKRLFCFSVRFSEHEVNQSRVMGMGNRARIRTIR